MILRYIVAFVLAWVSPELAWGSEPASQGRTYSDEVIAVSTPGDYLRLTPVVVNGPYSPVLLCRDSVVSPEMRYFGELYGGNIRVLSTAEVDSAVAVRWVNPTVIISGPDSGFWGSLGALLAIRLDCPYTIGAKDTAIRIRIRRAPSDRIRAILTQPGSGQELRVAAVDSAKQLVASLSQEPSDKAVRISDDGFAFIGAMVAGLQGAGLEVTGRTRFLTWVTAPEGLNFGETDFLRLVPAKGGKPGPAPYSLGILTASDPHDLALLVARTYSYPRLQGDWKHRLLTGSDKSAVGADTAETGEFSVVRLGNRSLTIAAVERAVRRTGYAQILAHGSPTGLMFADGGWPREGDTTLLPPLVFAAEACNTLDFGTSNPKSGMALKLIGRGAVAFVGSVDVGGSAVVGTHPYALSTIASPLGDQVRLQNAALAASVADHSRAVLIGDPTFHQFEEPWAHVRSFSDAGATHTIVTAVDDGPAFPLIVTVPMREIKYGEIQLKTGTIPLYAGWSVGIGATPDGQECLLEWPGGSGTIVFHETMPIGAMAREVIGEANLGVEALLIDLMTTSEGLGRLTIVITLVLLIIVFWRRHDRIPRERLWIGLLAGVLMCFAAAVYCMSQELPMHAYLLTGLGGGTIVVNWLVPIERGRWRYGLLATLIFVGPLLLLALLASTLTSSARLDVMILEGVLAVALVYLIALHTGWAGYFFLRRLLTKSQSTKEPRLSTEAK